jgi:hypothetical protein
VYSLVNAPTIGFDLARLSTGPAVATVLLEALAVQPSRGQQVPDLSAFDAVAVDDPRRAAAWLEVSALSPPPRLDDALSAARQAVDEATTAGGGDPEREGDRDAEQPRRVELEPVMRDLTTATFGRLDDLLGLARLDILDHSPPHVVALASDALAAAYGGRRLADGVRSLLGSPWITAARTLPGIPADLGPFGADVREVLDRAAKLTQRQQETLIKAGAMAQTEWSRRMHAAAWAVYLSGRLRPAAAAQFQAVRALRASNVDAALAARGVWNAVSGCLQAVVMHDLLDEVTFGVLVAPWESAVGILG